MIHTYGTGYTTKLRIRANVVSFGLKFKATVVIAKKTIYATAKFTWKHFGLRNLLLCLLFGVDLDAYSTGRMRKTCATTIA